MTGGSARPTWTQFEPTRRGSSDLLAVGAELFEVGDDIGNVFVGQQAGKHHLGPRNFSLRVLQIDLEGRLVPSDARILVGFGVIVAGIGTGLPADHAVQNAADEVLGVLADLMADLAFGEDRPRRSAAAAPAAATRTAPQTSQNSTVSHFPPSAALPAKRSLEAVT